MRSSFFWRLYVSYVVLVLVTATGVGALLHWKAADTRVAELQEDLLVSVDLVDDFARRILRGELGDPDGAVERAAERSDVRFTIIDPDGIVLADTHADPSQMENHRARPEIEAAAVDDYGRSDRFSNTLKEARVYVARALYEAADEGEERGTLLGFARVSIPRSTAEARLGALRANIFTGVVIGSALALALGLISVRRVTAPIREMTQVADALSEGRYESRVHGLPSDEIGLLGETLNRLAEELSRRIEAITRDDAQLRAMLVGMVEGVVAVDESDLVIFANASAREQLSISPGARGQKLWGMVRVAGLHALLEEARTTKAVARREIELEQDGRRSVIEAVANPFRTDASHGIVIVLHDITELRRLERVRRDFVANVSHELKTPLTSIKGYIETLMADAPDPATSGRFMDKVRTNVERLEFLVSDLLSLARIESSDAIERVPVDLRSILDTVVPAQEADWRKKELDVRSVGALGEAVVRGDREGLEQIIGNLLSNAIHYTDAGGRVEVRVRAEGEEAVLEVEDDGLGVPVEEQERIFERFYRVDKARSRALGGTGLGLSIVKHLVAAMQGTVEVRSEVGKGSCFTVRLPLAR